MTRRDITDQLAEAVERHSHVDAPELHELAERARRRRVRHQLVGGAAVCAGALAAGLIVWNAVGVTDREAGNRPAASQEVTYFDVPVNTWRPGTPGLDAATGGTLRFTPEGCPEIQLGENPPIRLIFPEGSRGVIKNGKRSVIDADGHSYGTEGETVSFRGGGDRDGPANETCTEKPPGTMGWFSVLQTPPSP